MPLSILIIVYLMFFLSGAAALIYQVVWVRSLTLIFGGSHLAVTVVLSIFMSGLAIGGYLIGRYVDKVQKPLKLYGFLELGIAFLAIIFMIIIKIYPSIYISLVQDWENSILFISFTRVLFSAIALIIPTTLMGGTLPALSRYVTAHSRNLRESLSFLYGLNTLGAVFGALAGGFFLLRYYTVTTTTIIAIILNAFIGVIAIFIQEKVNTVFVPHLFGTAGKGLSQKILQHSLPAQSSFKLILLGIGISGFCALGYEVLWTRVLTIVTSANVYSFTTMLASFLIGIALGSSTYGILPKIFKTKENHIKSSIFWFGIVQIIIGVSALLVTIFLRKLPLDVIHLYNFFKKIGMDFFGIRLWSNFIVGFGYMLVPAFFMGLSFPLAGKIHSEFRNKVGSAVGEVLASNTIGAILGASISGFLMIYLFGIERSLRILIVINIGFGLIILFSVQRFNRLSWVITCITLLSLLFFAIDQKRFRIWDPKYFAIFRNNQIEAFDTPEKLKDALENTDVLYYGEGAESIISAIEVKGGEKAFITNGRIEASSHLQGRQVMLVLGHLPMVLHKHPKNVLVIGLGSGMTLGAVSTHSSIEKLTVVEIEPKVINIARIFKDYNHQVLDNPKLKIIFNDGRNFLLTTDEKFDVITADPIHPWFRGAGYLYTHEYFKLAAEHLKPGGILCQWLPLYELNVNDLKSIVLTFIQNFKYTMLFLTHYDAELIGSNDPILIDEEELERKISNPSVKKDLNQIMMGSSIDFLSFFIMGTKGMEAFSHGGILNTDDNLYLEFSAPFSIGNAMVMGENVNEIVKFKESILDYIQKPTITVKKIEQEKRWNEQTLAFDLYRKVLVMFLTGRYKQKEFKALMDEFEVKYPQFAPYRFLKNEYQNIIEMEPRLIKSIHLILLGEEGKKVTKEIAAVLVPIGKQRVSIAFVDNQSRTIYGELYISGTEKEEWVKKIVDEIFHKINILYHTEAFHSLNRGHLLPKESDTLPKVKNVILSEIKSIKHFKIKEFF